MRIVGEEVNTGKAGTRTTLPWRRDRRSADSYFGQDQLSCTKPAAVVASLYPSCLQMIHF